LIDYRHKSHQSGQPPINRHLNKTVVCPGDGVEAVAPAIFVPPPFIKGARSYASHHILGQMLDSGGIDPLAPIYDFAFVGLPAKIKAGQGSLRNPHQYTHPKHSSEADSLDIDP